MDEDKIVCQNCGTQNDPSNNFCSKCAAPLKGTPQVAQNVQPQTQKKKSKKGCLISLAVVAVVVVIVIIAAIVNGGNTSTGASANSETKGTAQASNSGNSWDDKFEVKDLKIATKDYVTKVTGTIVNKTDKEYGYLQVEINEYDASGAQVGSTLANVNNLEAKGTWKFEAIVTEDSTKTVKVKDVTGF